MTRCVERLCLQLLIGCGIIAACSGHDTAESSANERFIVKSPVRTMTLPGAPLTNTALYATDQHTETTTVVRDGIPNLCMLDGLRAPMQIVRVARDPRPVAFRQEPEHLNCNR